MQFVHIQAAWKLWSCIHYPITLLQYCPSTYSHPLRLLFYYSHYNSLHWSIKKISTLDPIYANWERTREKGEHFYDMASPHIILALVLSGWQCDSTAWGNHWSYELPGLKGASKVKGGIYCCHLHLVVIYHKSESIRVPSVGYNVEITFRHLLIKRHTSCIMSARDYWWACVCKPSPVYIQ